MTDLDLLLEQLSTDNISKQIAAIKAIQHFDDERVLPALRERVNDASVAVVRSAILAIGHQGGCEESDFLLPLLAHESRFIRQAVVRAIGQTGCQDAVPQLVNLLDDNDLDALAREALIALKVDPDFF